MVTIATLSACPERLTDHPVLIPTSPGPVGAIVTEPHAEPKLAVVFLPGGMDAGRAGINRSWTRAAWAMASQRVIVLRPDHAGRGESWMAMTEEDRALVAANAGIESGTQGYEKIASRFHTAVLEVAGQVVEWFCQRIGDLPVLFMGTCYGGRLAVELALRHGRVAGVGLAVPSLDSFSPPRYSERFWSLFGRRRSGPRASLDATAVRTFRQAVARVPVWLLVGEHDEEAQFRLQEELGRSEDKHLDIEVVPRMALHPFRSPAAQREAADRIVAWVARNA